MPESYTRPRSGIRDNLTRVHQGDRCVRSQSSKRCSTVSAMHRPRPCRQLIVRRPAVDEREVVSEIRLDVDEGLVGDSWLARGQRHTRRIGGSAGAAHRDERRAADAIAGDVSRWPLAGDQIYVDFDIGVELLPPGTRLSIGDAEIEVSEKPHTGCAKFSARFGTDALRFVNSPGAAGCVCAA